jgi:hypothetical protein
MNNCEIANGYDWTWVTNDEFDIDEHMRECDFIIAECDNSIDDIIYNSAKHNAPTDSLIGLAELAYKLKWISKFGMVRADYLLLMSNNNNNNNNNLSHCDTNILR